MTTKKKFLFPILFTLLYIGSLFFIYKLATFTGIALSYSLKELVLEFMGKSSIVIGEMLTFAITVVTLHLVPLFIMIKSTNIASERLALSPLLRIVYFVAALMFMLLSILALNQLYFPRSIYSDVLPILSTDTQTRVIGGISLVLFLLLSITPLLLNFATRLRFISSYKSVKVAALLLGVIGAAKVIPHSIMAESIEREQPDIILIGLDSVAPLHIQHHPGSHAYLRSLLESGTSFSNTITPLARTYPAWTSILTGKYPVHHGTRFNLSPLEQINHFPNLLPKILRRHGYHTIYAQDERKFNNLDESFGFDTVVGPRVGASEFILTKISDIPMVNLALLLPWGDKLFPSIAHNSADDIHYSPDDFIHEILKVIPEKQEKPLFLATHLCLAHYPYRWRDHTINLSGSSLDIQHKIAMEAMGKQIEDLLSGLKRMGRLNNAVVVILSDHGESINYEDGMWVDARKGDRLNTPDSIILSPLDLKSSYSGHGTRILDKSQYTTLLSFIGYGDMSSTFKPGNHAKITSLVDIMPTILSAVGLIDLPDLDGENLLDTTNNDHALRTVLAETGMIFSSLTSIKSIDENAVLQEAIFIYTVDLESGRVIVKPELIKDLITTKDYAIHTKDWMIALIRRDNKGAIMRSNNSITIPIAILVHKPTGQWTMGDDQRLIQNSPLKMLTDKARSLLGDEVNDFSTTWPFKIASAKSSVDNI